MELVSVVVVTYNSSGTIIETLDSVKNQTYEKIELIISDDCSTDDTLDKVKGWLQNNRTRFRKIKILHAKHNHGVTKNCNIGIKQTSGKYIHLLAGDDILYSDAIEKEYNYAESKGLDIIFAKVEPFGVNIKKVNDVKKICEKAYKYSERGWECQNKEIVLKNFIVGPMCSFYSKKYFEKNGLFDIRFPMIEDYPHIYKYILDGNEINILDDVFVRYRVSGSSLCQGASPVYNRSVMKFFIMVRLRELLKRRMFDEACEQLRYHLGLNYMKK